MASGLFLKIPTRMAGSSRRGSFQSGHYIHAVAAHFRQVRRTVSPDWTLLIRFTFRCSPFTPARTAAFRSSHPLAASGRRNKPLCTKHSRAQILFETRLNSGGEVLRRREPQAGGFNDLKTTRM